MDKFDNCLENTNQAGYILIFSVNHNIAVKAVNGWVVKTDNKSQQDKIIIMK